jgi:hypothetical protein
MSKTTDIIDQLSTAQKRAISHLSKGELDPATKKGWYYTDGKCRLNSARVLEQHGLVEIDEQKIKATAMGKRVGKAL